jgi:hypothetical protein
MTQKYYSTDITISVNEIKASSKQEAEAIIAEFVALIAPIMSLKIQWDEADWTIEENVLNEDKGIWEVSE